MSPAQPIDIPGGEAPQGYTLAPGEAMQVEAVTATFDASAAAGAFMPTLSFYAQSGELLARQFAEQQEVGEVSEVTFAPFLRKTT